MPGMKIAGTAPTLAEDPNRPLFRAHKSLPRRTTVAPSVQVIHVSPVDHVHDDSSNGPVIATAPALPLTPPGVAQEELPRDEVDRQKTASSHSVAGAMTPSKPSHPPTPETTPPRVTPTVNRLAVSQFGQASASSRADSFQTAYEMMSDGETETPRRSSRSSSRSVKLRMTPKQSSESSDTITEETPGVEAMSLSKYGHSTRRFEDVNDDFHDRTKGPGNGSHVAVNPSPQNGVDAPGLNLPRVRNKSLQKRVRDTCEPRHSPSVEQFREIIGWPSDSQHDTDKDVRRVSGASAASSTIEAIIIDSPRPSKRTLRHTEKRSSLRSASSPIPRSQRTSLVSNPDSQHRLVHKVARITENDRRSIASEISNSGSSTLGVAQQHADVIPVVVIPQRRSSLKSSASTSQNPSKAGSRRSSRRAPTSSSRPGSMDIPRQRKRTLSDSDAFAAGRTESRGRSFGPPIIPPRSSSLSAPTSRNNSRTTSLTSESLRHHTIAMDLKMQTRPAEAPAETADRHPSGLGLGDVPDVPTTQSILIGVEDMAHLRPPSAPFTQLSIPSSSPGPIEINEATTIAFFPHNNESLLLVDPRGQQGPRPIAPRVEYRTSLERPQTPETHTQYDVDSPLKNPRRPPKPPTYKTIPPTQSSEADRQLGQTTNDRETDGRPSRRLGSLRRWAARPRSESFNSFTRSLSLRSAKNRKAGQDIDSRLDPFWRPRRFWEDSSDPEDSARDAPAQPARSDQVISNSLGLPQQRVVFEGPKISRRDPATRRRLDGSKSRYHASKGSLIGSGVFAPEALYSQTSLHHRQFRSLSWWRLRLRFGRVRSMRQRLRRTLQQRAEGKREARREKLKQSIGEAVLVGSSTQTRAIAR
ncbi:hypothetical protein HFD88_009421 [Aspergillus terreus]|nr:hypothetical protein HFD88_009421 [Aspergillus terreus]